MTQPPIKLRTGSACRVTFLDRERFNEAVASGLIPCVPETVAGRARLFDPDQLLSLWYYRELVEDGYTREKAGRIACEIADCAHRHPDAATISYVEDYFKPVTGSCYPSSDVPEAAKWGELSFSGTNIRKVTTFNVAFARVLIARETANELSIQGSED